jgi:dTMP kinase
MGNFIVIEGMDGCGKSTITDLLAKRIAAESYKTPPCPVSLIRKDIDNCQDRFASFFYYMASNFYAATEIKTILNTNKSVVCDRYYYTTLSAYSEEVESFFSDFASGCDILTGKILKPDYAFFLDVSEEERIQRLKKRVNLSVDDLESMDPLIRCKQLEKYKIMGLITIDTTESSPEKVVEMILTYMNN